MFKRRPVSFFFATRKVTERMGWIFVIPALEMITINRKVKLKAEAFHIGLDIERSDRNFHKKPTRHDGHDASHATAQNCTICCWVFGQNTLQQQQTGGGRIVLGIAESSSE